jgi:hypothetical protein
MMCGWRWGFTSAPFAAFQGFRHALGVRVPPGVQAFPCILRQIIRPSKFSQRDEKNLDDLRMRLGSVMAK